MSMDLANKRQRDKKNAWVNIDYNECFFLALSPSIIELVDQHLAPCVDLLSQEKKNALS